MTRGRWAVLVLLALATAAAVTLVWLKTSTLRGASLEEPGRSTDSG